jgi:protein TonB
LQLLRDAKSPELPAYRLISPYDRPPLQRRLTGLGLTLAINVVLLLVLLTLGVIQPPDSQRTLKGIVVDLIPQSRSEAPEQTRAVRQQQREVEPDRPTVKPPPIILPVKPTIAPPAQPAEKPSPWIEMSKAEMAASDIGTMPKAASGGGGDSKIVGRGPNGEALDAAERAREPTDAELAGYLPRNSPEGFGLIACKTVVGNRVEDCVELDQSPRGSHLASAVRQAAWQFRVRPPRKGGKPLIGSWVRIRIDYTNATSDGGEY